MTPSRPERHQDRVLGPLERRILEIAWDAPGPQLVRDVAALLGGGYAYTTVLTTMDRLFKKGLLARVLRGRRHVYVPAVARGELEGSRAAHALDAALAASGNAPEPLLSYLVDTVAEKDLALLDELERLVRRRRGRARRGP